MKKVMMILTVLGVMSSAQADEVARGLASVLSVPEVGLTTLINEEGVEGYLTVDIDVLSVLSKPKARSMFTGQTFYELSDKCSFLQVNALPGSNFLTQVTNTDVTYVDDEKALVQVTMLVGDGAQALGEVDCGYHVSVEDANEYGVEVLSIDYILEKGHLDSEDFNFHIDTRQLAIDNSVAA